MHELIRGETALGSDRRLCGRDFFWPTDTTQASGRIEYILIPAAPRMNVTPCTVWERSLDELHLAGTEARQDHRPIVIKMVDESAVQCR